MQTFKVCYSINHFPLEVFNVSEYLIIMRESPRKAGKDKGFTMIEMIFVLIVLFIMAALFISRYLPTGTNELMIEADGLKTSLRYAQMKAMNDTLQPNSNPRWGIDFPNAISYTLYRFADDGTKVYVNLPGEISPLTHMPSPTHTLSTGISMTTFVGPTVAFDDWGSPFDGSGNRWAATNSMTLTQGTQNSTITITKNTGFIQ